MFELSSGHPKPQKVSSDLEMHLRKDFLQLGLAKLDFSLASCNLMLKMLVLIL